MARDTCRMPGCEKESRKRGDLEHPDSNNTVSLYGAKFCSIKHELKYEKAKADAKDARRSEEERQTVDKKDLPEYDGPPY